jgi:hypothetical protein
MKSWEVPFIGTRVLYALEQHIVAEKKKTLAYAPCCSIVQSSGMGKSRLLDEFSKKHFLIPINLCRKEASGKYDPPSLLSWSVIYMFLVFPPPDHVIRDLLTHCDNDGMLHFLTVLFETTTTVITNDLKEARSRSERITKFREFMKEGQSTTGVGKKRRDFYTRIVVAVNAVSRICQSNFIFLHFAEEDQASETQGSAGRIGSAHSAPRPTEQPRNQQPSRCLRFI